jgi:predicted metal-dependent phosphoesterase TrpH
MGFADLHVHTVFSDGTCTPDELIREAGKAGLCALSVVDHDSISGIEPALAAARSVSVEVIPGIELTTELDNTEIHMLGYLFDYTDPVFLSRLAQLQEIRIERVYKIVKKLKLLGVDLDPQAVFEISGTGTPGRLHIARAMVKGGFVSSVGEAFQKYIGDRSPAYVLGFRFSSFDAIDLIKKVGGIPVLAHPYILGNNGMIPQLIDHGLMGLEVYYTEHSQSHINYFLDIARRHNLLVTGGSDFHGCAKPDVPLGVIKIPYELVEILKKAKHG